MIGKLKAYQIYDLMVEVPGSAEGRDAAIAGIPFLSSGEVRDLRDKIIHSFDPNRPEHTHLKTPFVRGYLLGQLGKIVGTDKAGIRLLKKHLSRKYEPNDWVRFWSLSGCVTAKLPDLDVIAATIYTHFENRDPGKDAKLVLLARAILASFTTAGNHLEAVKKPLEDWLSVSVEIQEREKKALETRAQDALRVQEILPNSALQKLVVEILLKRKGDPRTLLLCVKALAAIPHGNEQEVASSARALIQFVEDAGNTRVWIGVRQEALLALGLLRHPTAEYIFLKEIQGGSLDLIRAAAQSLTKVLGLEKAVLRVLEASEKDPNPHTRSSYAIALRWMSADKSEVAEALDTTIASGNLAQQENARMLLAEMGGASAVNKLGSREKALDTFKDLLKEEQGKFQKLFDKTMMEARNGFRVAIGMDLAVFVLGICMLVALMAYAFLTDTVDNFIGVGMGGGGVLSVVYGTLIANPRKKVFESVNALMNFKIVFLAYLRNLHQTEQAFTRMIMEDEQLTTEKLGEFTELVNGMLREAVDKIKEIKEGEFQSEQSSGPLSKIGLGK